MHPDFDKSTQSTDVQDETARIDRERAQVQATLLRSRLDQFETRLRALSPAAADGLGPPLTEEEFDQVWAAHDPGFTAPYEIRVWYTWHNSSISTTPWTGSEGLASSLNSYNRWIQHLNAYNPGWETSLLPIRTWVPLFGEATSFIADCDAGPDQPCPLYVLDQEDDFYPAPLVSSLATLVEAWHHCLDNNWWIPPEPDSSTGEFGPNSHLLPPPRLWRELPGVVSG